MRGLKIGDVDYFSENEITIVLFSSAFAGWFFAFEEPLFKTFLSTNLM